MSIYSQGRERFIPNVGTFHSLGGNKRYVYIETYEWSENTLRYESDVNGDILYFFVFCWIINSCCGQGFFALYTGAALATMLVATTIARPSLSIVQA